MRLEILCTARTRTTVDRDGVSHTSHGRLEVTLWSHRSVGAGTNPEQLFAAGGSACFVGAMRVAVARMVGLGATRDRHGLAARFHDSEPGVDREGSQALVDAPEIGPHSRGARRSIDVAAGVT